MIKLPPRLAMAFEMQLAGKSLAEIGAAMGVTKRSAQNAVNRARRLRNMEPSPLVLQGKRFDWEDHPARCGRCSLLLPCECLPSVWEVASSRRGEAGGDL